MKIKVTDLEGKEIDLINCTPITILKVIEEVKEKYPPGKYHANLITY